MESCVHCDETVLTAFFSEESEVKAGPFCCQGCLTVYQVLHQKGLGEYYEVKHDASFFKRRSPVEIRHESYSYLDGADFLKEYSYSLIDGQRSMEFYLEGIHCLACLWLIEKLPDIVPEVLSSKLNLDKSVVIVTITEKGHFALAASELSKLGYRPHVLQKNSEGEKLHKKEERKTLVRIGVAGAAAGNIMIYAVSLYGGADKELGDFFNLLTVLLSFPVLTYCAWPFYQSAWTALKNRTLSIDVPISLSLILGAVMGVVNILRGIPENYLDSLSTLVFLLLISRYFLKLIQENGLSSTDLSFFYQTESVQRKKTDAIDEYEEIHAKYIAKDDILKIPADAFFPVDGVLLSKETRVNNSLLTGESMPVKLALGDKVFSGTQNLGDEILVRVTETNKDSRLGKILKNVENGWGNVSRTVDITSTVSKYFTAAVIVLSIIIFGLTYAEHGLEESLVRAITLLIVTCPCALALAVPLTFNRSLSLAASHGIIIKNDEAIEKLSKIQNVILDKTGTVTEGKPSIVNFVVKQMTTSRVEDIIVTLESGSKHPVGKALYDYAKKLRGNVLPVIEKIEIPGKGVSGIIENKHYTIDKQGILEDGNLICTFDVKDVIRQDSRQVIQRLLMQSYQVKILSGDKKEWVNLLGDEAGLPSDAVFSEMSPEDKLEMIKSHPASVMVGDGANDAPALKAADVGIAVSGAMDISLRASDVFLTVPGLSSVEKTLILSKETMKVIKRNIILSISYNSISVYFVFIGLISPLTAAIIMPVSSLTVLISSLVGTGTMRSLWK